jgi:hypothetical protein
MKSLSRSIAVLSMILATLAGCGAGSDSDPSGGTPAATSTVKPASGSTIKAADYSYVVPKGWRGLDPESIPGFKFDSVARSAKVTKGFADNINVLVIKPAPAKDLDTLEDGYIKELEVLSNATDIDTQDRVDIGGESAVHISAAQSQGKLKYRTEQYGILRDGQSYVVTFSFGTGVSESERNRVAVSILTTWKWKS